MRNLLKVKWLAVVLTFILAATLVGGCGSAKPKEEKQQSQQQASKERKKIVIGVSNGIFGTEWRTEMLETIQGEFERYKKQGLVDEIIVQNAGPDINTQIQQMRNMINSGVSVIMVNANSATGLNGVIDEAKNAGIPVVSFDQAVTNPYAINVTVDHYAWGKRYAEWLAKALNGKGNIVMIEGLDGHPASEARKKAAHDVFKNYPDIKILADTSGFWDEAKAQQVMSNLLAAYPKVDGVWCQDAMALGVVKAFQAANRPVPPMTAELMVGFLKEWKNILAKNPEFQCFAQANPPGISGTAIGIAVRIANGKKLKPLKDNTLYYPIKTFVTKENLDKVLAEYKDKPDTYFVNEWLSDSELDKLFE